MTFGIDDINHPNSIRFGLRSLNNSDFPAVVSSASQVEMRRGIKLKDGDEGSIPFNWVERFDIMMKNPVGAAIAFKRVVHDIMTILCGIKPSSNSGENNRTTKTEFKSPDEIGMIGTPSAFFGKNETTGSGSLHFHVVFWGGLSPEFLESVADIPELCKKVAAALDSMYSAKLDRHDHVRDLVQKNIGTIKGLKKIHDKSSTRDHTQDTSVAKDTCIAAQDTLDVNNLKVTNADGVDNDSDVDMKEVSHLVSQDTSDLTNLVQDTSTGIDVCAASSKVDMSIPGVFALKKCCADERCGSQHSKPQNTQDTSVDTSDASQDTSASPQCNRGVAIPSKYPGITMTIPNEPIGYTSSDEDSVTDNSTPQVSSRRALPRAMMEAPDPKREPEEFKTHVALTVCYCGNIHKHSFTCKKPLKGWHGCRMCYSKALSNGGTKPIELLCTVHTDGSIGWEELDSFTHNFDKRQADGTIRSVQQQYVGPYDPEKHTTKENIYPLRPDCTRTVIWELDRPELKPFEMLDTDNVTKDEIIKSLYQQMIADKPGRTSLMFEDGCEKISMDQIDLHIFDRADKNHLFYALILGLIESTQLKPGTKSIEGLRRELMNHLVRKRCDYNLGGKSLAQHIESRMNQTGIAIDKKVEIYSQLMINVEGDDCFEGGELEVGLFSESQNINVAVYEKVGDDLNRVESESYNTRGEKDRPTIHLLRVKDTTSSQGLEITAATLKPPTYTYTLFTPKLKSIMDKLQAFDVDDLIHLYEMVANKLPERNGWVVDFNPILTGLLGSNTNLLHLGSTEQSKSALFYIGPYINKDGVKITDALPILLNAYEHAQKFQSIADDADTNKRRVQHAFTRAINKMNSMVEVTDTQAAATLLWLAASLCSDSFVLCDTEAYKNYVNSEIERQGIDMYGYDDNLSDTDEEQGYLSETDILLADEEPEETLAEGELCDKDGCSDSGLDAGLGNDKLRPRDPMDVDEESKYDDCNDLDPDSRRTLAKNRKMYELSQEEDNIEADMNYYNAEFGVAPLYRKNDGSKIPVSYAALYRFRGEGLKHLNRYEYTALVRVESVGQTEGASGAGRKKCKPFAFAPGLGIEKYHHQVLRSKHMTPKFRGKPPPIPRACPLEEQDMEDEDKVKHYQRKFAAWKKKADRFAHFYLLMFRAEDELYEKDQVNTYKYDYETFMDFYKHLTCKSYSNIDDRLLLEQIERVMYSWRVDNGRKAMLSEYRERARTLWSAEEKKAARSYYGRLQASKMQAQRNKGMDFITDVVADLNQQERTSVNKRLGHARSLMDALKNLDKATNQDSTPVHQPIKRSVTNVTTHTFDSELDESKRQKQSTHEEVADDDTPRPPPRYRRIHDLDKKVDDYIKSQDLSEDKDMVIKIARAHFEAIRSHKAFTKDYEAPNLLVCGKPGNGKSKIIESLDGIVEIMKVGEQMKCCYMGSAAVNIGGTTLLQPWNIPVFNTGEKVTLFGWNQNVLQALKNRFDRNVHNICAVIIDEISTVQPYMLAYLNDRMQKLFGNDKPFGGCMVILLGDFEQKPPTAGGKEGTLPGSVMRHIESKAEPLTWKTAKQLGLSQMGGYLFSKFRYIKLTSQHRSGDPKHMSIINKMSDTGVGPAVQDLKNTYKKLSSEDLDSDDFRFATVLVTGNAERREINAWQARRWAKYHKVNVVCWERKRDEGSWKGKPKTEACRSDVMSNSCFWEYFIPEAKGYINKCINNEYGLANGTEVKYISLSFDNRVEERQFKKQLRQAKPGEEIVLDSPPAAINVEPFADFSDDSTADKAKKKAARKKWLQDNKGSITNDGRVVVPISTRDGAQIPFTSPTAVPGNDVLDAGQFYRESQLKIKDNFPIEPAFAITTDKAQGKTIHRIILSISKHCFHLNQMIWEGLYVSLSRVRSGDHIRLLINGGGWETVKYVPELKRNKYTGMFFDCYRDHPDGDGSMIWSYDVALQHVDITKKRKFNHTQKKKKKKKKESSRIKKRGPICSPVKGLVGKGGISYLKKG